jgi:hypothetical protein
MIAPTQSLLQGSEGPQVLSIKLKGKRDPCIQDRHGVPNDISEGAGYGRFRPPFGEEHQVSSTCSQKIVLELSYVLPMPVHKGRFAKPLALGIPQGKCMKIDVSRHYAWNAYVLSSCIDELP